MGCVFVAIRVCVGVIVDFEGRLTVLWLLCCFFFQAEDGIRDLVRSRGLGDVYKRQMYRQDDVFFVTQDQFSYTAAVNGIMLRERPATNLSLIHI